MATTQAPPPPQQSDPLTAPPKKLRDAYVAKPRVRAGGVVARICAVGLMLGLLGGLTALADTSSGTSIFDMARDEGFRATDTQLPPFGFFIGPVLILILLPIAKGWAQGRTPRVFLKRSYLPRVVIATLLWIAGLVALIVEVSNLDSGFTIAAGTYIAAALISIGLLATLAMWPAGLDTVEVRKPGPGAPPPQPIAPPPPPAESPAVPLAAVAAPDASPKPITPPGAPARRSHPGRWLALAVLGAIGVMVGVLFFAVIQPDIEQKNDAKAALRDARSLVNRSYPISRAARRETMRAANSTGMARRVDRRLSGVISLRRRAIRKLAPVEPLPLGDDRYDNVAATWTRELRASISDAREIQGLLRTPGQGNPYGGILPMGGMPAIRNSRDSMAAHDAQLKATEHSIGPLL